MEAKLGSEAAQDAMIVQLYAIGTVWARTNRVTPLSVMSFLSVLMKSAERLVVLDRDGSHKSKAVLTVLELIIKDPAIAKFDNEQDRASTLLIVQTWAPGIIDWGVGLVHDPQGTIGKLSKAFAGMSTCCIPPAQQPSSAAL